MSSEIRQADVAVSTAGTEEGEQLSDVKEGRSGMRIVGEPDKLRRHKQPADVMLMFYEITLRLSMSETILFGLLERLSSSPSLEMQISAVPSA